MKFLKYIFSLIITTSLVFTACAQIKVSTMPVTTPQGSTVLITDVNGWKKFTVQALQNFFETNNIRGKGQVSVKTAIADTSTITGAKEGDIILLGGTPYDSMMVRTATAWRLVVGGGADFPLATDKIMIGGLDGRSHEKALNGDVMIDYGGNTTVVGLRTKYLVATLPNNRQVIMFDTSLNAYKPTTLFATHTNVIQTGFTFVDGGGDTTDLQAVLEDIDDKLNNLNLGAVNKYLPTGKFFIGDGSDEASISPYKMPSTLGAGNNNKLARYDHATESVVFDALGGIYTGSGDLPLNTNVVVGLNGGSLNLNGSTHKNIFNSDGTFHHYKTTLQGNFLSGSSFGAFQDFGNWDTGFRIGGQIFDVFNAENIALHDAVIAAVSARGNFTTGLLSCSTGDMVGRFQVRGYLSGGGAPWDPGFIVLSNINTSVHSVNGTNLNATVDFSLKSTSTASDGYSQDIYLTALATRKLRYRWVTDAGNTISYPTHIATFDGDTIKRTPVANLGLLTMAAEVSTNVTAAIGQELPVNSTSGARTITAPSSPVAGDRFAVFDSRGTAATNNITISSFLYNGVTQTYVISANNGGVEFRYVNSTIGWRKKAY